MKHDIPQRSWWRFHGLNIDLSDRQKKNIYVDWMGYGCVSVKCGLVHTVNDFLASTYHAAHLQGSLFPLKAQQINDRGKKKNQSTIRTQ